MQLAEVLTELIEVAAIDSPEARQHRIGSACYPIGRILLHIVDEADPENLRLSDLICTALQILNHCQDVKEDYLELGRVYLPADRLERHGVSDVDLEAPRVSAGLKRVLAELCDMLHERFDIHHVTIQPEIERLHRADATHLLPRCTSVIGHEHRPAAGAERRA